MSLFTRIIFVFFFMALTTQVMGQEIFRGIDEKGVITFADNPYRFKDSQPEPWPPSEDQNPLYESHLSRQIVVPYKKEDKAILIQGILNRKLPVTFILDTGASLSQITLEDAKRLDLTADSKDLARIRLADGRIVESPRVRLNSIKVGSAEVKNVEVIVGEVRLLGLNFLKAFRITMDSERGQLILDQVTDHR